MSKKNNTKNVIIKSLCFLISGVLVSGALMINIDTRSWFTSRVAGEVTVSAATTKDILKSISIKKKNPTEIKISKAENMDSDPIVYFDVDGEAAEYILHINSVKLESDKEYTIPIEPNINSIQYLKLFLKRDKIKGKIRVKYLNEFIAEEYSIEFSKKYLRDLFWEDIERKEIEVTELDDIEEARGEITKLITYLAEHIVWEEAGDYSSMRDREINKTSFRENIIKNESLEKESTHEDNTVQRFEVKSIIMPIEKIVFTSEQQSIIDIISPKLMPYVDELYSIIEELIDTLNEKNIEIANIMNTNQELELNITTLEETKEQLLIQVNELSESIKALETEKIALIDENEELEDTTQEQSSEIERLNERISKLEKENRSLRSENSRLSQSISSLREELSGLLDQISELDKEIDRLNKKLEGLRGGSGGGSNTPPANEEPEEPQGPEDSEDPQNTEEPESPSDQEEPEDDEEEPSENEEPVNPARPEEPEESEDSEGPQDAKEPETPSNQEEPQKS